MTTTTQPPVKSTATEKQPHKRAWWLVAVETIVLLVAAIFFLELFLRFCGVGQQEFLQPDAVIGCKHIPGQQVTWRLEGYSNDYLSSTGMRDVEHAIQKPKGVTRIALLGDSATEGLQVPLQDTYARVLDKTLNQNRGNTSKQGNGKFEVINFACSSYSTGQQWMQFEKEVALYQPEIAILLYNRGDSIENVRDTTKKNVEPRPYFYLDEQGKVVTDNSIMQSQMAKFQPDPVMSFIKRNSRIYGVWSQTNLALSINEKFYRKLSSWLSKFGALFARKNPSTVAPLIYANLVYAKQDAWKVTSQLIGNLNNACKQHHTKLIVLTFPNTLGDPEFAVQIDEIAKLSKVDGFGFIDLTPTFKANPDPNALFLQFHFSSAGHKLVADTVANYLQQNHLVTN